MDLYRWTSLFRNYDLNLRHNRLILVLSLIAAVAVAGGKAVSGNNEWPDLFLIAFTAGATVFSAGALSKEIYPDYPQMSLAAAVICLAGAWFTQPVSLVILFWLIGCLRVLNRSTGLAPKLTDVAVLGLIAAWLVWHISPLFGLLTGSILWLDALLPDGQKYNRLIGWAILLLTIVYTIGWGELTSPAPPNGWLVAAVLIVTVAFIPVMLHSYDLQATGDATGAPLNPTRVQAEQLASLATGLVLTSWLGVDGAILLVALWAAILVVSVHQLSRLYGRGVTVTA
ncbi:MAG: hypothetical protein R6X18_09740 [Chloroflexota bacterium]|jgi:hypothetical protein